MRRGGKGSIFSISERHQSVLCERDRTVHTLFPAIQVPVKKQWQSIIPPTYKPSFLFYSLPHLFLSLFHFYPLFFFSFLLLDIFKSLKSYSKKKKFKVKIIIFFHKCIGFFFKIHKTNLFIFENRIY